MVIKQPKKAPKLSPAMATRIRKKAAVILSNAGTTRLPKADKDSAAGAAT